MTTEQALAASPAVQLLAEEAATAAGVTSPDNGSVSTDVPLDTPILDISYSAADPQQAADWAHAYAQGYMQYRENQAAAAYAAAKKGFDDQIALKQADLATEQATVGKRVEVGDHSDQPVDRAERSVDQDADRTGGESPVPRHDDGGRVDRSRNRALSALCAQLVPEPRVGASRRTCARVRRRLHPRATRRPVPRPRGPRGRCRRAGARDRPSRAELEAEHDRSSSRRDAPKTAPAEAYRTLRTNVAFMARTNELKMISMAARAWVKARPRRRRTSPSPSRIPASASSRSAATCGSLGSTASSGYRTTSASRASCATE